MLNILCFPNFFAQFCCFCYFFALRFAYFSSFPYLFSLFSLNFSFFLPISPQIRTPHLLFWYFFCNFVGFQEKYINMPVIKQKQIRHFALDRCFRNKTKRYYIEDLLAECNKDLVRYDCTPVSERTLKYDINEFESIYHVNVLHLRDAYNRVYYRYEDTNFSIQQAPLIFSSKIRAISYFW